MTIIGIDLGTTNSLAAYWAEDGPRLIPNVFGKYLTPSVVSLDENDEILVGEIAKERLITHPHVTAATFKRFMGTKKEFQLGTHTFIPEELSSFVLKALKADAEAHLGHRVDEAVISVPAYFNDTQRRATKHAAELAGLHVERMISEPTAAALAYGVHRMKAETNFLVFDLGGGTFDVSILELFEGIIEVKSISGDNFLGGEDFTHVLVSSFNEAHGLDKLPPDPKLQSAIYKQAELCKYALSESNSANMSLLLNDRIYEMTVDRTQFEGLVNQLLQRIRGTVERALRDSFLSPDDLDSIVLIGGATRMPAIKAAVSKLFRKLPFSSINPDEAVALGAAVQVALKERNDAVKEVILTDVCPYTLGVNISKEMGNHQYESGYFMPIIERNNSIPVSKVKRVTTVYNNQRSIAVEIYQGESRLVQDNILLGSLNIEVSRAPAGEQQIDIRYTYDINGILEVEITAVHTGKKKKLVIENNPGSLTEEEIEERLKALEAIKIHPREKSENRLLLAKGARLFEELLGNKRAYVDELLRRFETVLSRQNDREIKLAANVLKTKLEALEIEGQVDF